MTVFTTGKFDVLHYGHFHFLIHLIGMLDENTTVRIMIDSDARIVQTTGVPPVFTSGERVAMLKETVQSINKFSKSIIGTIVCFDVFDNDDELELAYMMADDSLLVKGSEWIGRTIIGEKFLKHGVYYFENGRDNKISSSYIKQRIIQWQSNQKITSTKNT